MNTPQILINNEISQILDNIFTGYRKLSSRGGILGLIVVDQDAKVLATNRLFRSNLSYWDFGALAAALYGVSRQGNSFFGATDLERASIIYQNMQFFVHSIGKVNLNNGKNRELLMAVLGDKNVNIGLVILQMRKYANNIKKQIEKNQETQKTMMLTEKELRNHIFALKKQFISQRENIIQSK